MNSSRTKTLELAKKAVTRIAEVAVTQDQFDKWKPQQQKQWLKDHPTSKFGKKEATKSKEPVKQADLKKASNKAQDKKAYVPYKTKFTEVPNSIDSIIIDRLRTDADRKTSAKVLKDFEEDLNNQVKYMQENTGHGWSPSGIRAIAEISHKVVDIAKQLEPIIDDFNLAMRDFLSVRDSKDLQKIKDAANKLDSVLWKNKQFRGVALRMTKKGGYLKSVTPLAKACRLRLEYMAKARDAALKEAKQAGMTDKQKDASAKKSASMKARWGSMY